MTTISSTRNLVRAIEGLSQNLTEIASILKDAPEDAAAAAETKETETEKTAEAKAEKKKSPATAAGKKIESTPASSSESASEESVTFEDIRAVLAEKTQDGMTAKIRELLNSFGAAKLSKVPKEKYPELMKAAKALK